MASRTGRDRSPEALSAERPRRARSRRPSGAEEPRAGAVAGIDRLVHERTRLGILSALAVNESLSFRDLKDLLDTTDGNLSVHARKLEDAQLVACHKHFEGRVPRTEYRLTTEGRAALEAYLDRMEHLIHATRRG